MIKKLTYILLLTCIFGAFTVNALVKPSPEANRLTRERENIPPTGTSTRKIMSEGRIGSTTEIGNKNLENATSTLLREKRDNEIKIRTDQIQKVGVRLQATSDRLQAILNRLLSRIEKIKNAGGQTVDAEKYIGTAQISLDTVKTELNTLASMLGNDMALATTTKKKIVMDPAKKLTQDIEKNLSDAQKTLGRAVVYLMSNEQKDKKVKPEATTTSAVKKTNQ